MRRSLYRSVFLLLGMLLFSACSGGGGSKVNTSGSSTSVSGVVSFPAAANLVAAAKLTGLTVVDNTVTVEAYTLDGVMVPGSSVHPTYDDAAATRVYSYLIPGLKPGQDYLIKARRGNMVLKKLIPRSEVAAGTVTAQTIDAVSTAAVIVASQKLSGNNATVVLGDPLPAGRTTADISSAIETTIKPTILEDTIKAAAGTPKANITTADTANLANLYNIVVTASVSNLDPSAVCSGRGTLNAAVPLFVISGSTVTPPSSDPATWQVPSASAITTIATATAQAYTAPAENARTYTDLAERFLAAQDLANASLNYEKALAVDPGDKKANFGAAITGGVMLLEDADVKAIVARWDVVLPTVKQVMQGTSPVAIPFGNMSTAQVGGSLTFKKTAKGAASPAPKLEAAINAVKTLKARLPQQQAGYKSMAKELGMVPATAPTVSEMQSVISNVLMPKLDQMRARLARIEDTGFAFTITKAMQGNPVYGKDIVLDDGEFYTLDAALNVFQTIFGIATAYNFDLPSGSKYDSIGQDPLAVINNPSFFTLKTGGAARMAAALTSARTAAAKADRAFVALQNRAAGQGAFDLSTWSADDKTSFGTAIGMVTEALSGQVSFPAGDRTVTVDVTKFFTNPLTRADLPIFGYDVPRDAALSAQYGKPVAAIKTYQAAPWGQQPAGTIECSIVPKSDIPDYSLNGILPNNTPANNLAGFNAILAVADGKLLKGTPAYLSHGQLATDGTYAYTLATYYSAPSEIRKIDLATGTSSSYATLSGNGIYPPDGALLYFSGAFYSPMTEYGNGSFQLKLSRIYPTAASQTTLLYSTTDYAWSYLSSITSSGSDVYYILNSWDQLAYVNRASFYKLSGMGTSSPSRTLLFSKTSTSGEYGTLAVSGNYIYTGSPDAGLVKMDMTGQELAAYNVGSISWRVLVGGSFYGIDEDKVIRYANPASGLP